jgi:hypothetical protein
MALMARYYDRFAFRGRIPARTDAFGVAASSAPAARRGMVKMCPLREVAIEPHDSPAPAAPSKHPPGKKPVIVVPVAKAKANAALPPRY